VALVESVDCVGLDGTTSGFFSSTGDLSGGGVNGMVTGS